ncbi:sigma-54-dependent transcriptional regulator [Thermodesulfobacteriota bacterium]
MKNILVVDDDSNILKVIEIRLESEGYQVSATTNPDQAMGLLKDESFDLALIDLKLVGENGIQLMQAIHEINPELPVIILTAHGTIESAVEAIKKGAYSYLTKPFNYQELLLQIKKCMETCKLSEEVKRLRKIVDDQYGFKNIIGKSKKMKKVMDQVRQAAEVDSNVYINGESGTGKELMAKNLHMAGSRFGGPFVALNCSAIPETLLESELFGYERGAFTGALRNKKGFFQQAHGGSLFLDEISEMPLAMQSKLLRVLDDKEFYPLGGGKTVKVDTRIIAASNKDLDMEVEEGRFREDLFYRIHVIVISLPPLRERVEDIPLLARHFLKKYSETMQKSIKGFTPQTLQKLIKHPWPGNVRELENTIESAIAMTIQDVITEDLILPSTKSSYDSMKSLRDAKDNFERNYLVQLIELTKGNVSNAAKLAGKYRADLYELLKKHNLDPKDFREKNPRSSS